MRNNLIVDNELVLFGDVGDMWGDGSGFSAHDVIEALATLNGQKELKVRLNSGGGIAVEGIAIFNALNSFAGNVHIQIDGLAASAASVIAMAGDTITMKLGSILMIHDPSGFTWGTAADHDKHSEVLNVLADQAASIYAAQTGSTSKKMRQLMLTETWMSGAEAVAMKFATTAEEDAAEMSAASMVAPKFDYRLYEHVPPAILAGQRNLPDHHELRAPQKDKATMPDKTPAAQAAPTITVNQPQTTATMQTPVTPAPAQTLAAPTTPVVTLDVSREIMRRGNKAGLNLTQIEQIIDQANGNMDVARDLLLDAVAARDPSPESRPAAVVTADAKDKFKLGVQQALDFKVGLKGGARNEFSGMTMRDIARECLMMSGDKKRYSDPMEMISAAFRPTMFSGGHSTSDFVEILGNTANKSMLIGYEEAPETFEQWTGTGTLTDFKIATRVDLGLFPSLSAVPEGAEYNYATMSDRKMTLSLATYGKMFAITRQAIINDDLGAFSRIPNRMGRAAKRTIGNLVYAQITGNVTLDDGIALFHASHNNLVTAGGAPSVATVGFGRAKMALQTDPDAIATGGLNIRPTYALCPIELEDTFNVLMSAQFDPAIAGGSTPNPVRGSLKVISDARLSTDSAVKWYLLASPQAVDTIEVLYLNGVQTPTLEQRDGWNVDGVEFKVRMDAGVKTFDHRGFFENDGTP